MRKCHGTERADYQTTQRDQQGFVVILDYPDGMEIGEMFKFKFSDDEQISVVYAGPENGRKFTLEKIIAA